jgi:hypothetical protein
MAAVAQNLLLDKSDIQRKLILYAYSKMKMVSEIQPCHWANIPCFYDRRYTIQYLLNFILSTLNDFIVLFNLKHCIR